MSQSSNSSSALQATIRIAEGCCLTPEMIRALEQCLIVEFDLSTDSIGRTDLLSVTAASQVSETILESQTFSDFVEGRITQEDFLLQIANTLIESEEFSTQFITTFFESLTTEQSQLIVNAISDDTELDLEFFIGTILRGINFSNLSAEQAQAIATQLCIAEDINLDCLINTIMESDKFDSEWTENYESREECGSGSYTVNAAKEITVPFLTLNATTGLFFYSVLGDGSVNFSPNFISDATQADEVTLTFPNAAAGDTINLHWNKKLC